MSFEEDFAWQEKFRDHYAEIARMVYGVPVAPAADDWQRNTDFLMSAVIRLPSRPLRISARARRRKFGRTAKRDFTVRLSRPSGRETELPKIKAGWGDLFIYGVESAEDDTRLGPWFLGNTVMLRDYLANGGYYRGVANHDGSSVFAVFRHDDMPAGFVIASDGIPEYDRSTTWAKCPQCYSKYAEPLGDDLQPRDGYWRRCMFCGFRWRAGWVMRSGPTPSGWDPDLSYEAQAERFRARRTG